MSVNLNCYGTQKVPIDVLERAVDMVFDLRPAAIQRALDLFQPIYKKTTNFGHFGKFEQDFA